MAVMILVVDTCNFWCSETFNPFPVWFLWWSQEIPFYQRIAVVILQTSGETSAPPIGPGAHRDAGSMEWAARAQFFQGFLVSFGEKHRVWEVMGDFQNWENLDFEPIAGRKKKPDCQAVSAYFSRFALYINLFRNWKDPNMDVCQIRNMTSHLWPEQYAIPICWS